MASELLVIFGPPAVGKMTVAREVCERTDFRLFLNHHTIEPLSEIFGMDSPALRKLSGELRRRVVEEAAGTGVRLILTQVWDLAGLEDVRWMGELVAPYADTGRPVSFVELAAGVDTRLARNRGADRLAAKPSKRDLGWSEAQLREREREMVMNTDPAVTRPGDQLLARHRHLRIDNEGPDPGPAADRIVGWLAGN